MANSVKTTTNVNSAVANVETTNTFKMRCVAVKDNSMPLLKVYAEDGTSVSLPKEARMSLTEGKVFECELKTSKDGRFYVACGLGKKKTTAKATKEQKAKELSKFFAK